MAIAVDIEGSIVLVAVVADLRQSLDVRCPRPADLAWVLKELDTEEELDNGVPLCVVKKISHFF